MTAVISDSNIGAKTQQSVRLIQCFNINRPQCKERVSSPRRSLPLYYLPQKS